MTVNDSNQDNLFKNKKMSLRPSLKSKNKEGSTSQTYKKIQSNYSHSNSSRVNIDILIKNSIIESRSHNVSFEDNHGKNEFDNVEILNKTESKQSILNNEFIITKPNKIKNNSQHHRNPNKSSSEIFSEKELQKNNTFDLNNEIKEEHDQNIIKNKEGEDLSFKEKNSNNSSNSKPTKISKKTNSVLKKKKIKKTEAIKNKKEIRKLDNAIINKFKKIKKEIEIKKNSKENLDSKVDTKIIESENVFDKKKDVISNSKVQIDSNKEDHDQNKILPEESKERDNEKAIENDITPEKQLFLNDNKINESKPVIPLIDPPPIIEKHKPFIEPVKKPFKEFEFKRKNTEQYKHNNTKLESPKIFEEDTNEKKDNNTFLTNLDSEGEKISENSAEEFDFNKTGFN